MPQTTSVSLVGCLLVLPIRFKLATTGSNLIVISCGAIGRVFRVAAKPKRKEVNIIFEVQTLS